MSTQENVVRSRRFWEEGFNKGDHQTIDELVTADFLAHDPSLPGGKVEGIAALKQLVDALRAAMPDLHYTVEDAFGDGDRTVVRWKARGTHKGELFGIPPSGKQVTYDGVAVNHIADGKCREAWVLWDTMGFMQQIGAAPQPAAAQT